MADHSTLSPFPPPLPHHHTHTPPFIPPAPRPPPTPHPPPHTQTNFDAGDYTGETIPRLTGKTREEVKTTLKSERIKQVVSEGRGGWQRGGRR